MRVLHVKVEQGDEFLVAQALEEPGVITQGRTFDDLITNVRRAAELLLQEKDIHIELLVPAGVAPRPGRRRPPAGRRGKVVSAT
jgi:predicted RNase H-like HicB family nuclease